MCIPAKTQRAGNRPEAWKEDQIFVFFEALVVEAKMGSSPTAHVISLPLSLEPVGLEVRH